MTADVVIVGGGVAGLVAARRLVLGGRSVVVLEAADRPGGQVDRHEVGGSGGLRDPRRNRRVAAAIAPAR